MRIAGKSPAWMMRRTLRSDKPRTTATCFKVRRGSNYSGAIFELPVFSRLSLLLIGEREFIWTHLNLTADRGVRLIREVFCADTEHFACALSWSSPIELVHR